MKSGSDLLGGGVIIPNATTEAIDRLLERLRNMNSIGEIPQRVAGLVSPMEKNMAVVQEALSLTPGKLS